MTSLLSYYDNIIKTTPTAGVVNVELNTEKKEKKIKTLSLIGNIVGTGISSAFVISRTTTSKNLFNKILKTDFTSSKNIVIIAAGSILGGFVGGMINDKHQKKWEKIKEANFQFLSNVIFPLIFRNAFRNVNTKLTKNSSKTIKNIGNFVSVFGGVMIGAVVGSTIANKINSTINPNKEYERKLGIKDFLIHVDDLPIAFALSGVPYIDKLIPFILVSRGYDVGKQG